MTGVYTFVYKTQLSTQSTRRLLPQPALHVHSSTTNKSPPEVDSFEVETAPDMLDLKRTLALLLLAAAACAQTPVQGWTLLIRQSAGNVWAARGRPGHLHIFTVNPFSMAGCKFIRAGGAQQLISFVSGPGST